MARGVIAKKICARAEDLVFTSGGTEANNLGLRAGIAAGATRVIVSAIEHDAVGAAAPPERPPCRWDRRRLPPSPAGPGPAVAARR